MVIFGVDARMIVHVLPVCYILTCGSIFAAVYSSNMITILKSTRESFLNIYWIPDILEEIILTLYC